jgi:hypothetical protein
MRLDLAQLEARLAASVIRKRQQILIGRAQPANLLFLVHENFMYNILYAIQAMAGRGPSGHPPATLRTIYSRFCPRSGFRRRGVLADREGTADSVERLMGTKAEARFAFISDKAEFASDDLLDV